MNKQKACTKCGEVKPLCDFYKQTRSRDGLTSECKECRKKQVSQRYKEKASTTIKEYEQKRFQDPRRKAKIKEYQIKRRAKNPTEYAAHILTGNALRDGRLFRQPCEVCGKERSEAHHRDYLKPLEVTWLCRKHHLEEHGKAHYAEG